MIFVEVLASSMFTDVARCGAPGLAAVRGERSTRLWVASTQQAAERAPAGVEKRSARRARRRAVTNRWNSSAT